MTHLHVDHVSIAVPSIDEALGFFQQHFPIEMGVVKQAGYVPEFNWTDFYIGSFKLELIDSSRPGSFVERFLGKRGPGMHHWSFEATGLRPLLDRLEQDGVRIVDRVDISDDLLTAFISPRSAFGVLVQFWQVPQFDMPARPATVPFTLQNGRTVNMRVDHVSIAVRDIEATMKFFERYFPYRIRREPHPGWDGSFLVASFYINDYKVELIQPRPGRDGFVQRFLDRRGEGLHHLSIDIDDLDPYADQLQAAGVRIVDRQNLRGGVKAAFISPRSAYGTLIQLWQSPVKRGG